MQEALRQGCWTAGWCAAVVAGFIATACAPRPVERPMPVTVSAGAGVRMVADFEKPDADPVTWEAAGTGALAAASVVPVAATTESASATQDAVRASPLSRTSFRPFSGLWSERVAVDTLEARSGAGAGGDGGGGGVVWRTFAAPLDVGAYNVLCAQVMHVGGPVRNGQWLASVMLKDAAGKVVEGDLFPVTTRWEELAIDLPEAFDEGLDISRITALGVKLRPASAQAGGGEVAATEGAASEPAAEAMAIQTDAWRAEKRERVYWAGSAGRDPGAVVTFGGAGDAKPPAAGEGGFSVEASGLCLHVKSAGHYDFELWDRGGAANAAALRPVIEIFGVSPRRQLLGQTGTGLYLMGQAAMNGVVGGDGLAGGNSGLRRSADDMSPPVKAKWPGASWPNRSVMGGTPGGGGGGGAWDPVFLRSHWEVLWTSPFAALVEVQQEAGAPPAGSHLGEPAAVLTWRFMIYQWGQVFVHVEWNREQGVAGPIAWALLMSEESLDHSTAARGVQGADGERLLAEIYPYGVRQAVQTALPHRMQSGSAIGFIAKTSATPGGAGLAANPWWWAMADAPAGARGGGGMGVMNAGIKMVGAGINLLPDDPHPHADCMLLLNTPSDLIKAAAFSEYLAPPKVIVKQGELDRTYPGDADQDGFVEAKGFQVIRLASGRASFTIYPQARPVFHPAFLFTVPALEREALDVAHSRVLINIDGQLFPDPPQFPDGSYLLQLPYVIDKPVNVEAILVKR